MKWNTIFKSGKPIIGMIHLPPLPGSPRSKGRLDEVCRHALKEAEILEKAGLAGLLIENFGDAPFTPTRVEPHTIAAMAVIIREIVRQSYVPCGVNVLRNDAQAALAVAHVTGAQFIRVNIHTGVMATDQGIIEGRAHETLRYRKLLDSDVSIFADIAVKHAASIGQRSIEQEARETAYRGGADALIISGRETGHTADVDVLARVKKAIPDVPVLVGSGVTAENIAEMLSQADGVIVGTSLKAGGVTTNPVDPRRVARLIAAAKIH